MRRIAAVLMGLCIASSASATVIRSLSFHELCDSSTAIVRGVVLDRHSEWQSGIIWTTASVEIVDSIRGSLAKTIDVRTMGGNVDGIGQAVAGEPALEPGDEVVLFLEPVPGRGEFRT